MVWMDVSPKTISMILNPLYPTLFQIWNMILSTSMSFITMNMSNRRLSILIRLSLNISLILSWLEKRRYTKMTAYKQRILLEIEREKQIVSTINRSIVSNPDNDELQSIKEKHLYTIQILIRLSKTTNSTIDIIC